MRITDTARVGIGTDTPISKLEIEDGLTTGGAIFTLGTKETTVVANDVLGRINFYAPLETGTDAIAVAASIVAVAQDTFAADNNSTSLYFQTGKSEVATTKMVVDENGDVGIGTDDPNHRLEVVDGAIGETTYVNIGNGDALNQFLKLGINSNEAQIMYDNADTFKIGEATTSAETSVTTSRFAIAADGTLAASSSADISDQELKENIVDVSNGLDAVSKLKPRTFDWKQEAKMRVGTHYGFIAQEVETVLPDLVYDDFGIREKEDGTFYKSVLTSGIIPVLVKAIQELSAKVTALENA